MVLRRPQRVEAERLGEVGDPDLIADHLFVRVASLIVLEDQQDSDFHVPSVSPSRFATTEPGLRACRIASRRASQAVRQGSPSGGST